MADLPVQSLGRQVAAFTTLPVQRQLGVLLGLATVVALAIGLVMWGLRPTYRPLLPGMAKRDVAEAMDALSKRGVQYQIDPTTGSLMVPAKQVQEARLYLATEGLPRQDGVGFELLDQKSGIGMSRLEETIRYQRALEGELARSVETLSGVDSARVHLALPRESVFIRDRGKPAASVLVNLHPGRTVDERQIAGIVHMIASSVPGLEPERVTVVDQRGRLLTADDDQNNFAVSSRQLEYTQKLEGALRNRVEDILAPLIGKDGVRVQVAAQVQFRQVERTTEDYDPDGRVLRSEQISDNQQAQSGPSGVPGALTNVPPAGATVARTPAPPAATNANARPGDARPAAAQASAANAVDKTPVDSSHSATRNFEVDRTISHVQESPASLQRLSVAVVVDNRHSVDATGKAVEVPRTKDEMAYLTTLVEKAVGFNEARGDSVKVVNASFQDAAVLEPLPPQPIWQLPWVRDLAKQVLAGLGVLLLVLLVLRPTLKSLARPQLLPTARAVLAAPAGSAGPGAATGTAEGPPPPRTLEGGLDQARKLTKDDPRVVAQVVKTWMQKDE